MKRSSKNLFETLVSDENIDKAIKQVARLHPKCKRVKRLLNNYDKTISVIKKELLNLYPSPSRYMVKQLVEKGKSRELLVIKFFPDRIIHHCISQVITPVLIPRFIKHTYQSIKGRGIHQGIKQVTKVIRNNPGLHFVKIDIKQFYPSIDQTIMKQIFLKYFKCPKILKILNSLVDSSPKGLPIGNHTSQIFSNLYLTELDHLITKNSKKEGFYYFRYADDIVMLSKNKYLLKDKLEMVKDFLTNKRNLEYHIPVKGRVDDNGLDFLGVRIFSTHTLIRKRTVKRIKKLKRMAKKEYITYRDLCRISSFWSYYHHSNSFNLFRYIFINPAYTYLISFIVKHSAKFKYINFHKYNRKLCKGEKPSYGIQRLQK